MKYIRIDFDTPEWVFIFEKKYIVKIKRVVEEVVVVV